MRSTEVELWLHTHAAKSGAKDSVLTRHRSTTIRRLPPAAQPVLQQRAARVPRSCGTLAALGDSWRRHLEAEGARSQTVVTYLKGLANLSMFLEQRGMPQAPDAISREHAEEWMREGLTRLRPATVHRDYRSLQAFF